ARRTAPGSGAVWSPSVASVAPVDDRHRLAGDVRGVVDAAGAVDLAVAAGAARLTHAFDLVRPALHVGLGEVPSGGVGGQLAGKADPLLGHEPAGLARAAVAVPLQRQRHVDGEAVIDLEHIDVLRPDPGF